MSRNTDVQCYAMLFCYIVANSRARQSSCWSARSLCLLDYTYRLAASKPYRAPTPTPPPELPRLGSFFFT